MSNRLMITVAAAALIAGTGFATAQGSMGREAPAGGAGVQQTAPASPSAEEKGAVKNQRAQQDTKPGAAMGEKSAGEKSAQDRNGEKSKSISSQNEKGAPGKLLGTL